MPDITFRLGKNRRISFLSFVGTYKPGDLPPIGYNDWHEWARVQEKAGLRQVRCGHCSLWRYPQEIARTEQHETILYRTKRDAMSQRNGLKRVVLMPICLKCAEPKEQKPAG